MLERIVLAYGTFDLLHVAHVRHLKEARGMGDFLVVGVTRDVVARREKRRPIIPEGERLEMIRSLQCVSQAQLFSDSRQALRKWKPQIYVKGADYRDKGWLAEEIALCDELGTARRHTKPNPQTTSAIIRRIKCAS